MIFCVLCWRWPGRLFGVLNILDLPPCPRPQKHFSCRGGTGRLLSWALTLGAVSAVAHLIPPSAPNTRPPRLATRSASPLGRQTKYWTETFTTRRWQRIGTDLHRQSGLELAGNSAPIPSQLVCTILYSPSPCVSPTPLFSSIAMEKPCWCMYLTSVQMHPFEKENETLTYL